MKKRKIGILTLPLHNNYGGLLQAFALQKTIEAMGHEALLIHNDVHDFPYLRKLLSLWKQTLFKALKGTPIKMPDFTTNKQKKIIGIHTAKFVEKNIKKTALVSSKIRVRALDIYNFDAYVVGSDQVWRPSYTPLISNYFYDFLKNKESVKRISYAASFGVDQWLFSKEETLLCSSLAQKFDAISVREDSAVTLCEQKLGVNAIKSIDPTLLLSQNVYEDLIDDADVDEPKGKIFTYILDKSVANQQIVDKVTNSLKKNVFSIMPRKDMNNLNNKNLSEFVFPSVEEWINGFKHADFIITDSFHGTLFSIIFNKNFIAIGNNKRGLSRFSSILNQLGLQQRLVLGIEEITNRLIQEPVNYEMVNKELEKAKNESIAFLKQNL
ncbi:polysaccharide pyruvyl transferase family protein [Maribacter sp. CXY002]|uniref:polysaccharide pyruvyl transferase family protein n=1 Tax=Maribacter luteocoastalis TaxID=3407671 RepID=UPI003B67E39A